MGDERGAIMAWEAAEALAFPACGRRVLWCGAGAVPRGIEVMLGEREGGRPAGSEAARSNVLIVDEPGQALLVAGWLDEADELWLLDADGARWDAVKARLWDRWHVSSIAGVGRGGGAGSVWAGGRSPIGCGGDGVDAGERAGLTVVGFFTTGTAYEDEAREMMASCEAFGLRHDVVGVTPRGDWAMNCAIKARVVMSAWERTGGRDGVGAVVWVDADARVRRRPAVLEQGGFDFAVHRVERWEFASGTVAFGRSAGAEALLREWVRRCEAEPWVWDQVHLDRAWEALVMAGVGLRTLWLPQAYTKIFDRAAEDVSGDEPVIEHMQASRRLATAVSGGVKRVIPAQAAGVRAARRAARPRTASERALDERGVAA